MGRYWAPSRVASLPEHLAAGALDCRGRRRNELTLRPAEKGINLGDAALQEVGNRAALVCEGSEAGVIRVDGWRRLLMARPVGDERGLPRSPQLSRGTAAQHGGGGYEDVSESCPW